MGKRRVKFLAGGLVGLLLAFALFSAGVAVGWAIPLFGPDGSLQGGGNPSDGAAPSAVTTVPADQQDLDALMEPFWEAWDIVHNEYVDQPVDDVILVRGAIRGMLDSLGDQHTTYMDPEEYEQANTHLEGEYQGIGAWVDTEAEYLTIISPIPNSPAEKVGLRPGDQVIAVDGEDMTGIPGNLVIKRVLGPVGTKVRLTIHREGVAEPFEVEIIRKLIIIPSVESEVLEGEIAYVRLYNFGSQTTEDFRAALTDLLAQNPRGLILDLRGNGGGFLTTAIEVASEFISEGEILIERFGDGREEIHKAMRGGSATEIPMVVLVDGGSASASEIVAGAIQDHKRGVLIGETTFGKGSVQNWIPLRNDQGAIKVTIARWYTPDDRLIHETGLAPDFEVPLTEEDIEAERDPQLDRAIEFLRETTAVGALDAWMK